MLYKVVIYLLVAILNHAVGGCEKVITVLSNILEFNILITVKTVSHRRFLQREIDNWKPGGLYEINQWMCYKQGTLLRRLLRKQVGVSYYDIHNSRSMGSCKVNDIFSDVLNITTVKNIIYVCVWYQSGQVWITSRSYSIMCTHKPQFAIMFSQ